MSIPERLVKPLCWLVVLLFIAFMVSVAKGDPLDSVCRIYNEQGGATDIGSGTLVSVLDSKTPGQKDGLVLTCAHLFSDGVGRVVCEFPNGRRHQATLLPGIDEQNDLAALEIGYVKHQPVTPVQIAEFNGSYRACGFGGNGTLHCTKGKVKQVVSAGAQGNTIRIVGQSVVRSGDSGSGVFNDADQLVGVVWGGSKGGDKMAAVGTYATYGKPLAAFLAQYRVRVQCPDGSCSNPQWQPSTRVVSPQQPTWNSAPPSKPATSCDCKDRLAKLESSQQKLDERNERLVGIAEDMQSRLAALESREPQIGPPGQDGKDGRDGKDAVVDIDAIAQSAAQIVIQNQPDRPTPEVNYKNLAREILSQSQVLVDAIPAER